MASPSNAANAPSGLLPSENTTWLLKDSAGDVIAYFSFVERNETTGLPTISADISGRHYDQDAKVVEVLEKLKASLGGNITSGIQLKSRSTTTLPGKSNYLFK